MGGICLVAGTPDAAARVDAMLAGLRFGAQQAATILPDGWSGIAAGKAWDPRLPGEGPPQAETDGLIVLVEGEIFGEDAVEPNPGGLIARHYREDDMAGLAGLNGAFVAAIIDPGARRITLATDRFGARNLFVWSEGEALAAATALDPLLRDDRAARRLSVQGIAELLSYQRTFLDQTQYTDIAAMPAAQVWTHENGKLARRQTRRLSWTKPDFSPAEGTEMLGTALTNAARRRVPADGEGALLHSGGMDSRIVLGAAMTAGRRLNCLTTGSHDNLEVACAREAADRAGMPFRYVPTPPLAVSRYFEEAVVLSDGLFSAPLNLRHLLGEAATDRPILLSGHGLDYTLRGYYLPCFSPRIAGSRTRLPRLRPVRDGSAETVAAALRVGIGARTMLPALRPEIRADWEARATAGIARALASVDAEDPYDSWDAYILHSLARHYAYSDFVAIDRSHRHRTLTFDTEVFDLYRAMPPAWRAAGRMAQGAMVALAGPAAAVPDANTGLAADRGFWTHISYIYARAALRRLGLARRPALPDPTMTQGSWPNMAEVQRRDPWFRDRLARLHETPALMDSGLFDRDGLATIVDDHLAGRTKSTKLMNQLLTLAVWFEGHGYTGVDH